MRTLPTYAGYFSGRGPRIATLVLAGVAQSFLWLPFSLVLRRTFDQILPARDLRALLLSVGALLFLQIGGLALGWYIRIAGIGINQEMLAQLRKDCLRHLYDLPRDFHVAADLDHLHVTIVYETNWIEGMNNALATQLLPGAFSALALFLILFGYRPSLAIVIAIAAPALFVVNRLMTRRVWFRQERLREAFERFSRGVRFAISALELTRSQAAEKSELERQFGNIETLRRDSLDLTRLESGQQLVQTSLILTSTLTVLLAGGWAAAGGRMTTGDLMSFYVLAALFATQARSIVDSVPAIRMGTRAFRQIATLLAVPATEPYSGAAEPGPIRQLSVEKAAFWYRNNVPVIAEVTLTVNRGESVALIGANGSGKSTLLFLIAGFYRPQRGTLSVNGMPYEQLSMRALRLRMAVVPQNPFLFGGTIRENVTYGNSGAGADALDEALRAAGADFVREFPEGLDTAIGENGVRISGGQRQRLVIARALLRRPELLILDEPTNHLDDEGIAGLMESLANLPYCPAVILISHERRVLRHTTRAWRLAGGRLIAAGEQRD
ncbi:MAG TPA: ABC transporter ATP-binding protein [Bryobacteraceae bacterium]|nr:ABC transporter ATP-binding protein [Bryobacteraceae bacterium]